MTSSREQSAVYLKVATEALFKNSSDAIVFFDEKHCVVAVNQRFTEIFGYSQAEIEGKSVDAVLNTGKANSANSDYTNAVMAGEKISGEGIRYDKNGNPVEVVIKGLPIVIDDKLFGGYGTYTDIREIKKAERDARLNEARLQNLIDIFEYRTTSIQDLLDYTLDKAITLTGSKIGYIYFYDEESKEFTLNTWSKAVMNECSIMEPQTVYKLEKTGIWGEAVRQRQPIVINNYLVPDPLKKGYPAGHAQLTNFLTIPVISEGEIVAVVGVANKQTDYNQTDILQLTLLMEAAWKVAERKSIDFEVQQSREWYRTMAEDIPALVTRLSPELQFTYVNDAYCRFYGKQRKEVIGERITEFVPEENRILVTKALQALSPGKATDTNEHTNEAVGGIPRWIRWTNRALFDQNDKLKEYLCVGEDITEQKKAEEDLRKSEVRSRALISAIPDMLYRYNREGVYLDAEVKYSRFMSEQGKKLHEKGDLLGKKVSAVLPPGPAALLLEAIDKAVLSGELQVVEYSYPIGEIKVTFEARLVDAGSGEVVSIVRDITERKRFEEELRFLSLHDHLTGLFNRAYFENELKRLNSGREYPVSIISVDLDGMKLINDTLGHAQGDTLLRACAAVIRQSLRESDVLARVGGDEFVILLPRTDMNAGLEIVQRMHIQVDLYNRSNRFLPLSVSIGIATAEREDKNLEQVYIEADERMYREKLQKGTAVRTYLVDGLIALLGRKDYFDQGHGRRISILCQKLGEKAGLKAGALGRLKLLAKSHDLGKVGISDQILFKNEALTEDEWKTIRQHPEKGYRIALASNELAGVAELILKHHEWWDGAGYPLGLRGGDIPPECRIFSIVDAYDAMTSERNYRVTKCREEATAELEQLAGSQFDPNLVPLFISLLEEK